MIEYKSVVITPSLKNWELEDQLYDKVCTLLESGWEIVDRFVIPACANPNNADRDIKDGYENINALYNRVVFIIKRPIADVGDGE